jgi:DNA polymerase V
MRIVEIYELSQEPSSLGIPLFISPVKAGFPSIAEDYLDLKLDLNEHLIRNPATTYFVRVAGDSMQGAGILDGDLMLVDRSLDPEHGRIAVVLVEGEYTVKRLHYEKERLLLMPENEQYSPIEISLQERSDNFRVWGIVTYVIHTVYANGRPR